MNIGIIGAGNVGTGLAKRLVAKGHSVFLSFSKDANKLARIADLMRARSGSVKEAVAFSDLVILATPWSVTSEALQQATGTSTKQKILWDCTNALKADLSGLEIEVTTSAGEEVAKMAPWAEVVKAIPPFAEILHTPNMQIAGKSIEIFVCGDFADAKTEVRRVLTQINIESIDAGPLRNSRYIEPAGFLLVQLAYSLGFGTRIGLRLMREPK